MLISPALNLSHPESIIHSPETGHTGQAKQDVKSWEDQALKCPCWLVSPIGRAVHFRLGPPSLSYQDQNFDSTPLSNSE